MEMNWYSSLTIFLILFSCTAAQSYKQVSSIDIALDASIGSVNRIETKDDLDLTKKMNDFIQNPNYTLDFTLDPLRLSDISQELGDYVPGFGSIHLRNITIAGLTGIKIDKMVVNMKTYTISCTLSVPSIKIEGKLYADGLSFPPRILLKLKNVVLNTTAVTTMDQRLKNKSKGFQLTGLSLFISAKKVLMKSSDIVLYSLQSLDIESIKKTLLAQVIKKIIIEVNKFLNDKKSSEIEAMIDNAKNKLSEE